MSRRLGLLRFERLPVPRVWGGRRLGPLLARAVSGAGRVETAAPPIGESWDVQDLIAGGSRELGTGRRLGALVRSHRAELLGRARPDALGRFPLLLKLLDVGQRLSLQVHPERGPAHGDLGKHEAWVVLEADEGAEILLGLAGGAGPDDLLRALARGEDPRPLLRAHRPRPGDVFDVPPGSVHCLGPGLLLYEIQDSSDLTYRLHDWGRLGLDGRPRPLHLEEAAAALDARAACGPVEPRPLEGGGELLVEAEGFRLERRRFAAGRHRLELGGTCALLTLVRGRLEVAGGGGRLLLAPLESLLAPAGLECVLLAATEGPAELLVARPRG